MLGLDVKQCVFKPKKKFSTKQRSHLGSVTGLVLILIKYVCFVVNVVSVMINVCLSL
jgi:hypothetical protein